MSSFNKSEFPYNEVLIIKDEFLTFVPVTAEVIDGLFERQVEDWSGLKMDKILNT